MEKELIALCAPTLARLKTGSLFRVRMKDTGEWFSQFRKLAYQLRGKGVQMTILQIKDGHALLYVYRKERLQQDMACPKVAAFLALWGYHGSVNHIIRQLRHRVAEQEEFPHEIGFFLGYPFEDVAGFIRHQGKNCKCAGCWKVYGDEEYAKGLFQKYEKCRLVYMRLWQTGTPLQRLAVAG